MALQRCFFLLSVILSLLLTTIDASSRCPPTPPKTTVLDVVSALQQAKHIISSLHHTAPPSPVSTRSESDPHDPSNSISLELLPRDTLFPSQHKDYKSLVLSRLERDSSRVAGISTKIRTALQGVKSSDDPEGISTPVFSGASVGIPNYYTRIGVGTPAKDMYMWVDTGSDVSWIQCKPCDRCFNQTDPISDPSSSSTYKPLSCSAPQCAALTTPLTSSTCRSGICQYHVTYADGSFSNGDFATETLSFGDSVKLDGVPLGCGHDNGGLFGFADGLLGLGRGPLSLTRHINATSFSYCLVSPGSRNSSSLEFNSVKIGDGEVTAPLLRNPKLESFYYVGLSGFSVGGEQVSIPESFFKVNSSGYGGAILDSGTFPTILPTQAYNSLRDAFVKKLTPDLKKVTGNISVYDTCYDLSSANSSSAVEIPVVTLRFTGGKSLDLAAKNILFPVDDLGTFCFPFFPIELPFIVLGNLLQEGTRVTINLADNIIGFTPNQC